MSINFDNYNNIVAMFFEKSKEMKDKPYLWKKTIITNLSLFLGKMLSY